MSEEVVDEAVEELARVMRKKKPYLLEVRDSVMAQWETMAPVCWNKADALALLKAFDGETEYRIVAVCSQGTKKIETVVKNKIVEE